MPHQLGILLVHGIGDQVRGSTLLSFGDPLIQTARAWLADRGLGSVEVVKAELSEERGEGEMPAQAELRFEVKNEGGEKETFTWLLVENWWAREFHKPRFTELASWIFRIGPWAIISHAMRPFLFRSSLRPWHFVQVLLAVPFCWLAQALVLLLSLLAWLPIPPLRKGVSSLLLHLTGTLGDSYVLLNSPAQRAAARGSVTRNLEMLSERCEHLAVVAHSQGAAIAHDALKGSRPENLRKLITFGSGIAKLKELEPVNEGKFGPIRWTVFWTSLLLLLVGPAALEVAEFGEGDRSVIFSIFFFTPAVFLLVIFVVVYEALKKGLEEPSELSLAPLPWSDYYAESDPVPNGPIVSTQPWLNTQAVVNHGSPFIDHNRYWENRDDFVRNVLAELSGIAGGNWFDADSQRLRKARRHRVRLLSSYRALAVVSIGMAIWAFRGSAHLFGRSILAGPLASNTLAEPIAKLAQGAGAAIGAVITYFAAPGWLPEGLQAPGERAYWIVGMFIPIVVILAWHHFGTFALWKSFDQERFRWLCRGGFEPTHPVDRLWRPICGCVVGLIPLGFSIGAIYEPHPGMLLAQAKYTVLFALLYAMAILMCLAIFVRIWQVTLKPVIAWVRKKFGTQALMPAEVPVRNSEEVQNGNDEIH